MGREGGIRKHENERTVMDVGIRVGENVYRYERAYQGHL